MVSHIAHTLKGPIEYTLLGSSLESWILRELAAGHDG